MLERLVTSLQNIFKIPELRSRVLFTLAMLAVYRIGAHVPTPGINNEELFKFLTERGGALMGFLDIFSGGALSRLTIFALGIMPYQCINYPTASYRCCPASIEISKGG